METHEPDWIKRMETLEADVKDLKAALLGTLDGKLGLKAQLDQVIVGMDQNSVVTQRTAEVVDSLKTDMVVLKQDAVVNKRTAEGVERLMTDRAKLWGLIVGSSACSGALTGTIIKLIGH